MLLLRPAGRLPPQNDYRESRDPLCGLCNKACGRFLGHPVQLFLAGGIVIKALINPPVGAIGPESSLSGT